MEPGRELDALVYEKVMGKTRLKHKSGKLWSPDLQGIPEYSTEIEAAWGVVEALSDPESRHRFSYSTLYRDCNSGLWSFGDIDRDGTVWPRQDTLTAPHAICLAALKAVGAI